MLVGYAWVSTAGESFDLQKEALDRAGVERLFADVGTAGHRPQLEKALARLRQGHTLVVWSLDRLGRSLEQLIEMVEELGRRGIGFRSLQEDLDTTASATDLRVFATLARFGRDDIREQRAAAAPTKTPAPCRRRGRKPKLDERKQALAVMLYKDPSNSVAALCRRFRIGRTTLYRYVGGSKQGGGSRQTQGEDGAS